MTIEELIIESKKHECNIGIISVYDKTSLCGEQEMIELRLSKNGYHLASKLTLSDISIANFDLVAAVFNDSVAKIEDHLNK